MNTIHRAIATCTLAGLVAACAAGGVAAAEFRGFVTDGPAGLLLFQPCKGASIATQTIKVSDRTPEMALTAGVSAVRQVREDAARPLYVEFVGDGGAGVVTVRQFQRAIGDFFHRPKPPDPLVAAGKQPLLRPDEFHPAAGEGGHVLPGGRVQPHFAVHGGRNQNPGLGIERQGHAGEGVVGQAEREFRDAVRGGGRDEQQVRLVGQLDVGRFPALLLVIKIRHDSMARERFEGEGSHKAQGIGGHHHPYAKTVFDQLTGQIQGLVDGAAIDHAVVGEQRDAARAMHQMKKPEVNLPRPGGTPAGPPDGPTR